MGGPPIRQPISSRLKASFCSLSNIIFFFDEFWNIPGDLLKIPGTYKGSFKGSRPFPAMNVQNYAIYYFWGMFPKERYIKASYFAAITVDQTPARAKNVNKAWWTGDEHWTLVKKGDLKEKTSYYYFDDIFSRRTWTMNTGWTSKYIEALRINNWTICSSVIWIGSEGIYGDNI